MFTIQHHNTATLCAVLLLVCGMTPVSCLAESIVRSSISINASSDGEDETEQSAHVKIIINGDTVEDWHATGSEPISYERTVIVTDNESNVTTESVTSPERLVDHRSMLLAIIKRLKAILELYAIHTQQ